MKTPLLRITHATLWRLAYVVSLALFFGLAPLAAQVPQLINYTGRVAVGTVNFDGSGQFKFALVNGDVSTTFWSNDGTSTAGSQPTAAVSLPVTKGLVSVLLGDTALPNMTAIPNSVFSNSDVRLRVWFNDGTTGFQLLTPDQRIAAVGYAMMAGNVPDGAITSSKLATNLTLGGTTTATFSATGDSDMQGNILKNPALGMLLYHPEMNESKRQGTGGTADIVYQDGGFLLRAGGSGNYSQVSGNPPYGGSIKPGSFFSLSAGWSGEPGPGTVWYMVTGGSAGSGSPPSGGFGFKAVEKALKGVTINGSETEVDLATQLNNSVVLLAVYRGTTVDFFVNGVLKGSSSSNLPTGAGGYCAWIKNNGATTNAGSLVAGWITVGNPMF